MRVEPGAEDRRPLGLRERQIALASWCRIAADDGSTVAYVPSETLAKQIVRALAEDEVVP